MTGFPEKICKLNDLLKTPKFAERNFQEVFQVDPSSCQVQNVSSNRPIGFQDLNIPVPDPIILTPAASDTETPPAKRARVEVDNATGTRVMALPSGSVECNKPISDLIQVVKPIIRELVEDSNMLKMWISFLIPKIEDGNNFGVSIQEDTLAEIQSVESEAAAFFDQISR